MNKFLNRSLIGFFLLGMAHAVPVSQAYSDLKELLPPDFHGWFSDSNQTRLEDLIKTHDIKLVVELGAWLGKSTMWFAEQLPEDGFVYSVDTWEGGVEPQYKAKQAHRLPTLYNQFLSNVIHKGLEHRIYPMRMTTLEAAKKLHGQIQPDLVYVDASHQAKDVYLDLVAWYPFVKERGILCGDDWCWSSVRIAVVRFAEEQGLEIQSEGNFWWFPCTTSD